MNEHRDALISRPAALPADPATAPTPPRRKRLAIVGGGAAGFFLAVNVKEMVPALEVVVLERAQRVLRKVAVSGGGRCNCTNTFARITDLRQAYPRGANLLKRLFKRFGPKEAFAWFEARGVPLVVQEDECVFPRVQRSAAIIHCFLTAAERLGVQVKTGVEVDDAKALLRDFDFVAVAIGGTPKRAGCVPSLFTFQIADTALQALMGTVVENAVASLPGTKFRAEGALLLTHWGMSGPAVLKLSSYAARHLAEKGYRAPLRISWVDDRRADDVMEELQSLFARHAAKQVENLRPFLLPTRLWEYLLNKASLRGRRAGEIGRKGLNRLADLLLNDTYEISGRGVNKEEFVTCGGVSLDEVAAQTLESKSTPGLYYCGEVLDVDGITGGFNLQAAWTTAYTVAEAIATRCAASAAPSHV